MIKTFINFIHKIFCQALTLILLFSTVNSLTTNTVFGVNYRAKIADTERQAEALSKQVEDLNRSIEDTRLRQGTLQEEIIKIKEEAKVYTNLSIQARSLATQYQAQKQDLESEIGKLKDDVRKIYREIQKQNLTSPIQSIFTATNLGDVISKIYANSTLESKAVTITEDIKDKIIEKENAIANQKQTALRADSAERQAQEKQLEVQKLLDETKGDEKKYKEIAQERNKEIEETKQQRQKFVQAEREEEERVRKVIEEQRKLAQEEARKTKVASTFNLGNNAITTNYNRSNTNFGSVNYDGKCRFEALDNLGVAKGYFVVPAVGNFEREFAYCNHDGIDISNSTGTPIYASAAGRVVRSGYTNDGYGNNVILVHSINGKSIYTLYGHLSQLNVGLGDTVASGSLLGKMGSTGNSTGPHLHFMIMAGVGYDGPSCRYANTKCYKPRDYINW